MNAALSFHDAPDGAIEIGVVGGPTLWRYVYAPDSPAAESPRPFIHPLYSRDGDVLTNRRPNDHPWHHGVSFMLTSVDGVNFWGGPSHRAEDGYQWRNDQGQQRHLGWVEQAPERLLEQLEWINPQAEDAVVLQEERELLTTLTDDGWSLEWVSRLTNPHDRDLVAHNYHSLGGLEGSHYTGLQFRGARGLLDEHGDDRIGIRGEQGSSELDKVHGVMARNLEWHVQTDGSLRRAVIRFESPDGPIPWFVRPDNPLVAFPPHREQPHVLSAGQMSEYRHRIHFLRA